MQFTGRIQRIEPTVNDKSKKSKYESKDKIDRPGIQKQELSASQDYFEKYINIIEWCPWGDIDSAILKLQELGDTQAIPYIQPYLNSPEPNAYRAALEALEKLGDTSILDHILSVISGKTDRLPILISFLNYSSFRKNEEVISALAVLLNQKEHASLLIPFLENTSLCKHPKVVPVLIDLLRDKDIDLNEKTLDLRKNIIDLLGKTENKQALKPLYAHAYTSSVDLRNLALLSIMELNFDESMTFLYHYLKNIKSVRENNLLIGVKICEFIVSSKQERTKEMDDAIESFCKLFEQNASQFQDVNFREGIRSRLQKVMSKIGRKYPKSGLCFIATAACGSESEPEVVKLRRFRDEILLTRWYGRLFVILYERFSPHIARWIAQKDKRKSLIRRLIIKPIAGLIG